MQKKFYKRTKEFAIAFAIVFGFNLSCYSTIYTNDMDYVLGDAKQAFIQNKIKTEAQADNLLLGFKNMGVNGIRIPIYAAGYNPNKTMFDYFYKEAVAQGFFIFANPAQSSGGHRIACGTLSGTLWAVKGDTTATNALINRVKDFANEYKCKWINPFNEDGRPDAVWSTSQMNTIYASLFNNVNGAELVGPCVWGIPASIDVFNNTDISKYITVATTHNLGFNHNSWPTFISAAKAKNLPVWDSEVNHNDKKGTGTRLEKALEYKVDGLVMYNIWNTINLSNGSINTAGKTMMDLFLKDGSIVEGVNLATSGTASQSSVAFNSPASLANDGNTNGNWGSGSVSITDVEDNPWWQVDLGLDKTIGNIEVYNRTDACCKDRLSNFTIYVIDSGGTTTHSETFTSYPDPMVTSNAGNVQGQIVKIQSNVTGAMNIAEVKVFEGDPVTSISTSFESLSEIKIFPNPVSNIFTITNIKGAELEVYNSLGKLILRKSVESNECKVNVSGLSSGVYMVRISNNGIISNYKIIKEYNETMQGF